MKRILNILCAVVLVVSFSLIPAALVGADPDPGIVGLWHFDEGTGTIAADSSGNGYNGTVSGADWTTGKFDDALEFHGAGTGDRVEVGNRPNLNISGTAITLEAWIKADTFPVSGRVNIISKPDAYALQVADGGKVRVWLGPLTNFAQTDTVVLSTGTWHHIAGTYNGSNVCIYVDGSLEKTVAKTGNQATSSKLVVIGKRDAGAGGSNQGVFDGIIDEVRIWNEVVNPVTVPLCAGQNMDVGTVTVWDDGTNLCVKYETRGDWMMTETHLAVVDDDGDFPTTKTGNPEVGHFPDGDDYDPPVSKDTFTFNLDDEGWASCTDLYVAAHAVVVRPIDDCWESVWQIGDVEVVNETTNWLENYADEFNWGDPAGPITMGPSLADETPLYTDPFIHGTTPTDEFPFNSNSNRSYATDFDVQWSGALPFGGMLTISWSPGQSAAETKKVSGDGITPTTFNATGASKPDKGWFMDKYPLVENSVGIGPLPDGTHTINFKHTNGDGTFWDWVLLEKPCEQEETAWGDGCDGERFVERGNWATYFMYHVEE